MKFNGKNIIFDDDITLTSEGLEGMKLSDVLRGLYSKTSRLESYMKWLYQYGGVGGSGGGSGSGGQGGYSLYVTIGGIQVTGGTLNLSSGDDEWYDLVVKIQNPEGATVRIGYTYYYTNDSGTKIKAGNDLLVNPIVLNSANSYTYSTKIRLNCNDTFLVSAQDDLFGIDKQVNCNIITNNYTFNAYLSKNNGDAWSDSKTAAEIFTEEARSEGLNIAIDYDVAIPVNTTFNWSFVAKNKVFQGQGNLTQGSPGSGKKLISLIFNNNELDKFEAKESDAGYYSVSLSIAVDMSSVGQVSGEPWVKNMTFNLIPQNLYLLVSSITGTIYSAPTTSSDRYEFNPGIIGFRVNSYRGNDGGAECKIEYRVDSEDPAPARSKTSTIRTEVDITDVSITNTDTIEGHNEHEHWIDFRLTSTAYNAQYPQDANWVRYYFYVKPLESAVDYPWADGESTRAGHFNVYRGGLYGGPSYDRVAQRLTGTNLKSLYNLNQGAPYQQSTGSNPIVISDITYPTTGLYTTIINIGLQYSEINSEGGAIFTAIKGSENTTYLTITQNSIKFGTNAEVSYYFPKTLYENFSSIKGEEYHLLSIVQRLVRKSGNNSLYEITVYVDGVLEGAAGNYVTNPLNFKSFTLQPCNCLLNLFEVSYLTWTETGNTGVEDLNIYQYWLKYNSTIRLQELGSYDVSILPFANKFTITDTGFVSTEDRDTVANLSTMCGVPTLVMTIRDDDGSVFTDMNMGYDEEDKLSYDVSLEWSNGKDQLAPIAIPSMMPNAQFVVSIQGSSTKKYKCKNWNLALENRSGNKLEVSRYLYSPNFDRHDYNTFLPEEEFTLKADVVDSSHSNNTSIGRFVNDVTTKFVTGHERKTLGGYIKNCLEGFPILVYICLAKTVNGTTTNTYYYQGIYNFNLGRSSYYNLGYKDIDVFVSNSNILIDDAGSSFSFYQVDKDDDNMVDGLLVAEIQGNSPYFDFSQYDKTILFQQGENDKEYMFGDIEKASQSMTETEAEDVLVNLVKMTSLAGGFIFDQVLRKTISSSASDMYGYSMGYNATLADGKTPANQVPNYRKNIVKKNVGGVYTFKVEGNDKPSAGATALEDFIGDIDDDEKPGFFDYQSLSEYYTICMAFGLVDSVQKNMNIKSWGANKESDGTFTGKFYAAFYDMDTCLGINNAGKDTTYFAFSDYWDHDDTDVSNGVITPKAINIYRDYSPKNKSDEEGGGDYYDTASSYLFAVAKYAIYRVDNNLTQYWPKRLWALWRTTHTGTGEPTAGCLSSAKKFMSKYFQNNLGKVSIPMINMNYRNKYFVFTNNDEDEANSFSKRNFQMFNGTRIHKAEDWLNGRFHILDAYFNLPDANSPIQYYENGEFVDVPNGSGILTEPTTNAWNYSLRNNPDITVLQDIFTSGTSDNSGTGTIDVRVKAREFTPLFINSSTKSFRYLLSANKTYKIYQDLSGLQAFTFGGSSNWVEMDSINTFPFSSLYVNSKYLENLSGSYGALTINGADITMPSLKQLILTGPNYKVNFMGDSKITYEKFPNLVEVNFNNVNSCNTEINGSKFTSLSIANILSGSINVSDCYDMTSLNIGAGTEAKPSPQLDRLIISPVSAGIRKLNWNRTGIRSITLSNESSLGDSSITIQNDNIVEEITLTGFSTINVQNCPNLARLSISDSKDKGDKLKSITIIKCGTQTDGLKVNSTTSGIIDLSGCHYITYCGGIRDMANITEIHFSKETSLSDGGPAPSNKVEVAGSCFYNDTKLKYISGSQIVLTSTSTFANCNAFTMKEGGDASSSVTNLYVKAGVTSLASTFSCSGGSSAISRDIIKTFLEGSSHWADKTQITSMAGMFNGQGGISYTEANLKTDLSNSSSKLRIDLRDFVNLSAVNSMFAWSGVSAYHPDTLGFGKNVSTINFTDFSTGVTNIAICPKSLMNIIGKISQFGPSSYTLYTHSFILLNASGTRLTSSANLKDYFMGTDAWNNSVKPDKIQYLNGLHVNTVCASCNLSSLFGSGTTTYWPELLEIRTSFRNNQTNYSGLNTCGVNTLPKLNYLYESFNIPNATIDFYTFFNWDKILTRATPFVNRHSTMSDYELGCINFKKTITQANLSALWAKILSSANLTSLAYFFSNCSLTGASSDKLEEIFGSTQLPKITSLASAFKNFTVTRSGTTADTPIVIDHFLSLFPNATNFNICFKGTRIGKQLPRDFFGRRQIDSSNSKTGVYFTKGTPVTTSRTYGSTTTSKIWEEDNTGVFEQGNITKYNYKIFNAQICQMFYNCEWKRYGDGNNIQQSAKCYRPENDDTEIEANYFTIGSKKYYNGEGGYKKDGNNTVYYSRKIYNYQVQNGTRPEVNDQGQTVQVPIYEPREAYYYEIENTVIKGDENSEIFDLQNLESDHSNEFMSTSGSVKLYNYTVDDPSHLFIAPDFFYPVNNTTSSNITSIFATSVEATNRLEGMIPEHLFKNCKDISFSGVFSGLNITPRYWKTFTIGGIKEKAYVYIPQNFTNYATLSSSFTFNLNVPEPGSNTEYKKYYVMFRNSIPSKTTTLSNSLPSNWIGQSGTWVNFGCTGYEMGTHYNIMVNENSGTEPIEGIDASYFQSLKFNYLVNGKLSWVLHGNLFNSAFYLENLRMTTNDSGNIVDFVIYTTNYATDAVFVSRGLIFPSTAKANLNDNHIISFSTTGGLTISRSQIQGCTDFMANAYTTIVRSDGNANSHIKVVS